MDVNVRRNGWWVVAYALMIAALVPALATRGVSPRLPALMAILLIGLIAAWLTERRGRRETSPWRQWALALLVTFLFSVALESRWGEPAWADRVPWPWSWSVPVLGLAFVAWAIGLSRAQRPLMNSTAWSALAAAGLLLVMVAGLYLAFGQRFLLDPGNEWRLVAQIVSFALVFVMAATCPRDLIGAGLGRRGDPPGRDRIAGALPAMRRAAETTIYVLLLVALALSPSQVAFAMHGFRVTPADLALGAALFLWLVVLRGQTPGKRFLPPWSCWALVGVAALAMLGRGPYSPSAQEPYAWTAGIGETAQFAEYFLVAYALFANFLQGERRRGGLIVLLAATGVAFAYAGSQALAGEEIRGLFGSRTAFAGFAALMVPIMVGVTARSRRWATRALLTVAAGIGLWVLCWPEATWGALAAMGAGLIAVSAGRNWRRATGMIVLGVLTGYCLARAFLPGAGGPSQQFLEWQAALNLLNENFLWGVGPGAYQAHIGRYYYFMPNLGKLLPDTQNGYLVIATTMGFVGLVALVAVLWHFAGRLRRPGTAWRRALAGALVSFVVLSLFTMPLVRGTGLLFAWILAMIAVTTEEETICSDDATGG